MGLSLEIFLALFQMTASTGADPTPVRTLAVPFCSLHEACVEMYKWRASWRARASESARLKYTAPCAPLNEQLFWLGQHVRTHVLGTDEIIILVWAQLSSLPVPHLITSPPHGCQFLVTCTQPTCTPQPRRCQTTQSSHATVSFLAHRSVSGQHRPT